MALNPLSPLDRRMFQIGTGYSGNRGSSVSPLVAPNEVIIDDRSYTFDTEKLVENIKAGLLDGTDLYPILTAPGVIKGTQINQILLDFAELDEPEKNPNRLFAPSGMTLEERSQTGLYRPGDFGSYAQDLALLGTRGGQSLANIGIGLANLTTGAYDAVSDYFTGPDFRGAVGGLQARRAASTPEAIERRAEPPKKFDYIPLTQPKDIAEMRINQMGDLILASSEIDEDLKMLLSGQVEQEDDVDVVDTAVVEEVPEEPEEELPKGIVEIRNIVPRTESETFGPLSVGEADRRRLEYEKAMIGRDEFGNPLPDSKLLQSKEIQKVLDEIRPAEVKVDVDKTEIDSLADIEEKFAGMSEDEISDEIKKEQKEFLDENLDLKPKLPDIDLTQVADDEDIDVEGVAVDKKIADPGFFGTNRFIDFIRNVGLGLEEKGQLGSGLAAGAAKASKERAARDLLEFQEDLKFNRNLRLERAKAKLEELGGPSDSMKKELRKVGQEMNADYNDIVSAKNTLEIVGRVKEIINNEDTSSVRAFLAEALEKGREFFDINGKPTDDASKGLPFDKLESRTRAKVLLNQIKQKNIRDILGESGKTISNLDRQIVEQLVGDISLGATQAETLEALRITEESIFNNLDKAQKRLKTNFFFAENENGLYLVPDVETILSYLQTGTLPVTEYNKGYESDSITKITL